MIYIKRILWALGWIPVFILESVLGLSSIFLFPFIGLFYYIKNGDVETTPDKYLPMMLAIHLGIVYKRLEPKS